MAAVSSPRFLGEDVVVKEVSEARGQFCNPPDEWAANGYALDWESVVECQGLLAACDLRSVFLSSRAAHIT